MPHLDSFSRVLSMIRLNRKRHPPPNPAEQPGQLIFDWAQRAFPSVLENVSAGTSNFAIAYLLAELLEPARIALTIMLTPWLSRTLAPRCGPWLQRYQQSLSGFLRRF